MDVCDPNRACKVWKDSYFLRSLGILSLELLNNIYECLPLYDKTKIVHVIEGFNDKVRFAMTEKGNCVVYDNNIVIINNILGNRVVLNMKGMLIEYYSYFENLKKNKENKEDIKEEKKTNNLSYFENDIKYFCSERRIKKLLKNKFSNIKEKTISRIKEKKQETKKEIQKNKKERDIVRKKSRKIKKMCKFADSVSCYKKEIYGNFPSDDYYHIEASKDDDLESEMYNDCYDGYDDDYYDEDYYNMNLSYMNLSLI